MDIQIVLQHVFGFIGICTVINWIHKLVLIIRTKKELPKDSCPMCKSPLSPMRSTNKKECTSCDYKVDWNLDPGQMPLVRSNRMVKRNEKNQ